MYKFMFENLGFRVLTALCGEQGIRLAAVHRVDVVVTDYEMPGMNGEAVALAIKAMNPRIPVVLFSGSTLIPSRVLKVVDACCDKAGSRDQLLGALHRFLVRKGSHMLQPPPVAQASEHLERTVA